MLAPDVISSPLRDYLRSVTRPLVGSSLPAIFQDLRPRDNTQRRLPKGEGPPGVCLGRTAASPRALEQGYVPAPVAMTLPPLSKVDRRRSSASPTFLRPGPSRPSLRIRCSRPPSPEMECKREGRTVTATAPLAPVARAARLPGEALEPRPQSTWRDVRERAVGSCESRGNVFPPPDADSYARNQAVPTCSQLHAQPPVTTATNMRAATVHHFDQVSPSTRSLTIRGAPPITATWHRKPAANVRFHNPVRSVRGSFRRDR